MKKITMNQAATIAEIYKDFITSRKVKGLADKTIETYKYHLHAVSKHLDIGSDIGKLKKLDLDLDIGRYNQRHGGQK